MATKLTLKTTRQRAYLSLLSQAKTLHQRISLKNFINEMMALENKLKSLNKKDFNENLSREIENLTTWIAH